MHAAVAAVSSEAVELLLRYGWDCLAALDSEGRDPVDLCIACMQARNSLRSDALAPRAGTHI